MQLHFIYLVNSVLVDPQWEHLQRFLHPYSKTQNQEALLVGADLELGQYLCIRAKSWDGSGSQAIRLHHHMVASILDVPSHTTQLGFVDLSAAREQLADQTLHNSLPS